MDLTLTVTQEEAGLIGAALGQLPYSRVCHLLRKLEVQEMAQTQPPIESPEATSPS